MPTTTTTQATVRDTRTVKERVAAAFNKLRRDGFAARGSFMCCEFHGYEQIKKQYPNATGYVFYHINDAKVFTEAGDMLHGRQLQLSFARGERRRFHTTAACAQAIVDALRAEHLAVLWSGATNERISVTAPELVS